jgi:hypothetical protein
VLFANAVVHARSAVVLDGQVCGGRLELMAAARLHNARLVIYDAESLQCFHFHPNTALAASAEVHFMHWQARYWLLGPANPAMAMDISPSQSMEEL